MVLYCAIWRSSRSLPLFHLPLFALPANSLIQERSSCVLSHNNSYGVLVPIILHITFYHKSLFYTQIT